MRWRLPARENGALELLFHELLHFARRLAGGVEVDAALALRDARKRYAIDSDRVFVAGIDVAAGGNVFGLTRGLHDELDRKSVV